jgi:hypothetical protein
MVVNKEDIGVNHHSDNVMKRFDKEESELLLRVIQDVQLKLTSSADKKR